MKIVACYKLVPEEQDIQICPDKTLDFSKATWKVGQYDLNAVEAGMCLAAENNGKVIALSVGNNMLENSKLQKGILARGPDEMFAVSDAHLASADPWYTAQVLVAAIRKIGDIDLVLCGEGSGDIYSQLVGNMVGALLAWPTVNAVSSISKQGTTVHVERSLENDVELLEIPLPAVLSVSTDINRPRIPAMKEILAAGKKPCTVWNLADLGVESGNKLETVSTMAPAQADRKQIIIEGDGEDQVRELYEHLRKVLV